MMYEIKNVKQYPGEPVRRWFFDHDMDLTVWFDDQDQVVAFQICYDKPGDPHALTWRRETGCMHHKIDDGERLDTLAHKGIPILMLDGIVDIDRMADTFREKSRDLPPEMTEFVLERLVSCADAGSSPVPAMGEGGFMTAPIKPEIAFSDVEKIDIRVGTIVSVSDVENSRKLMKLTVDFGDRRRTILAGIKQERENPREIEGMQALFVVNLPPREMAGEVSEGMLFDIGYADGVVPVLAVPEKPVPDGTRAG